MFCCIRDGFKRIDISICGHWRDGMRVVWLSRSRCPKTESNFSPLSVWVFCKFAVLIAAAAPLALQSQIESKISSIDEGILAGPRRTAFKWLRPALGIRRKCNLLSQSMDHSPTVRHVSAPLNGFYFFGDSEYAMACANGKSTLLLNYLKMIGQTELVNVANREKKTAHTRTVSA